MTMGIICEFQYRAGCHREGCRRVQVSHLKVVGMTRHNFAKSNPGIPPSRFAIMCVTVHYQYLGNNYRRSGADRLSLR